MERLRRQSNRASWAAIVALLATIGALSPAAAQDGDVDPEVVGTQASVTVVVAGQVTLGPPPPGALPDWPYTCYWDNVFNQTEVILGSADSPIPGHRYWLRCIPTDPGVDAIEQFVVYDPADPVPIDGVITSLELMGLARAAVQPNPLEVGISPADLQITGVESWLWPEGPTATIAQSASTNGLAATVQAQWSHTVFELDEPGVEPLVCDTQEAWSSGADESSCSHVYLSEGDRIITATSHWDFFWWDNGAQQAPVFLETVQLVEALDMAVVDLEAVITARR